MDLAKTAREITRFMLPYPTTRQSRQLEKVISHCPFDESQLAEDGCEFESESFLDLFMSAKRLEGRSDRTICYYEATIKKSLNLSMRQLATWKPKKLGPIFPTISKKPASLTSPLTTSEESSQASTHGSKTETISSKARSNALKESRLRNS